MVFLRQSTTRILFEWVDGGWCVDEPDDALNSLKGFLNVLLDREKELVKEYNISYIYDEHQPVSIHLKSAFPNIFLVVLLLIQHTEMARGDF